MSTSSYENSKKILIGTTLKNIRHSLGLTQEQVSEQLGLTPRYISDIERDKTKGSLDTFIKLCNIYSVSPNQILKDYLDFSVPEIDDALVGYYNLDSKEQDLVKQIISFMNKQKNNN